MAPSFKVCSKELIQNFSSHLTVNKPSWHNEGIRIIMQTSHMSDFWIPA